VDTEDDYFEVPRLITGEGLTGTPGIHKILDITEQYGFRSNVFMDVYNHLNFQPGVLQGITQSIHDRGHAVELHTHPDYAKHLNFYRNYIYKYPLEGQIQILEYGKHLIHEWTGEYPIAHRGGSYAMNEDTLVALHQVGIPIDSSLFFQHKNNQVKEVLTVNKVCSYAHTIEVPVTFVRVAKKDGRYRETKFDLDGLSYNQLVQVIKLAKEHNLRTLTLFLHSFSFISRKTKKVTDEDNPQAIFRSLSHGGSIKCEILGVDENDIVKYHHLLNYIAQDTDIEVLTFREWYKTCPALDYGSDFIPIVDSTPWGNNDAG
jgi:hypothetical protein